MTSATTPMPAATQRQIRNAVFGAEFGKGTVETLVWGGKDGWMTGGAPMTGGTGFDNAGTLPSGLSGLPSRGDAVTGGGRERFLLPCDGVLMLVTAT